MRRWISAITGAALALAAHAADAAPLPQAVVDIIEAAADDPDGLKAVVKAAKKANPDSIAEIDAHVDALRARVAREKAEQVARQSFLEGWTGEGEIGGSVLTGNTVSEGLSTALAMERKTPVWEQAVNLAVDYKHEDDKTTKDRYFGTYTVTRNFSPRFYAVFILWGERDRFAGYNYRFSESPGLGYRLLTRPNLKLRLEGGPALRQAEYLANGFESTVALRTAGYLTWRILPRLEFSQSIVTYLDPKNSTLLTASALTTKLQGDLALRAAYEVRHEEDPPQGREPTDTTGRATLVFSF